MGNRVREFRQKQKMSQEELSKKSGISRVTISYIETGHQIAITNVTMCKIAEALGKNVKTVFFCN